MKKAYLSISYSNRKYLQAEIETIRQTAAGFQIDLFVFVDARYFSPGQENEMMQQAFADIESADLLIAEVTEKAIGVGIEIGYAVALYKPVIYLRNAQAEHSTTAAGSAQHTIIYQNPEELGQKLAVVLSAMASWNNEFRIRNIE